MEENEKTHPLILVFYLDRELMENREIMGPYAEYINQIIALREANAMAFFIPTDGDERVECVNPIQMEPAKMEKIMKMVDQIAENFLDIGQGADDGKGNPDNEIVIPDDNE
jgi:hypothetical protein